MPRVCARPRCGRELLNKDGSPNYQRKFCCPEHLAEDKAERLGTKRDRARRLRSCSACGRRFTKTLREPITGAFVSGQRPDPSKTISDEISPAVKLHSRVKNEAPGVAATGHA